MKTDLTPQQLQHCRDNGFVVLHEFLAPDEWREWREAGVDTVAAVAADVRTARRA